MLPVWSWLTVHQVVGAVTFVSTIALTARLLRQRRPAGTSMAWLLGFVLVPYLAIPLFLVVGERKLRKVRRIDATALPAPDAAAPSEVVWLDRPDAALDELVRRIRRAERTIDVSTFILGDDEVGREIIEALAARARAGVEVRLLLDGLFARRPQRRSLRALRAAGGHVRVFLPLLHLPWRGRTVMRDHRKLAIFDGAAAIMGGMNLSADYLGRTPRASRWRDLSIVLGGEPARALARLFRSDWELAAGRAAPQEPEPAPARSDVAIVPTGPDCAGDPWHDAVLQLLFDARRRIAIATPYFAPDESLLQALAIAARRGVDVSIVVPARSNHWLSDRVAGQLLRDLAAAGVTVWRYRPAMLHAKCLLVDDQIAAVGSANFNARSLFLDFEVTAVLRGAAHNARMAAWFAETIADAAPGPPPARRRDVPIEAVARLLSPFV
jgi:cardiolipin synthase